MRVLELFKGTGSISKAIGRVCPGADVTSVDIVPRYKPTHLVDILKFDYKQYKPGHFDFIWASPPCTSYSKMQDIASKHKSKAEREDMMKEGDKFIQRTLDIIDYFKPRIGWLLENPATGYLPRRDILKPYKFVDTTYCMYGYPYMKRTRIWGSVNLISKLNLKHCKKNKQYCSENVKKTKKHEYSIGISRTGSEYEKQIDGEYLNKPEYNTLDFKYSIPPDLCDFIMTKVYGLWTQ